MENSIALSSLTKATTELVKQQKSMTAAQDQLVVLLEQVPAVQEEIQELELKKQMLAEDLNTAERQHKVDLDLRVQENEARVFEEILAKRNLTTIEPDALVDLESQANRVNRDVAAEVSTAVAAALQKERTNVALETAEAEKDAAVAAAQVTARIESLEAQLAQAQREASMLASQLDSEREAGVKRAEAAGSMTINTSSK